MWSIEKRLRNRLGDIWTQLGDRIFRRKYQARETEAYRLRGRGMFVCVIEGLIRLVVVNRAVFVVMVVMNTLFVFQLVDERDRIRNRRQAALHGETIQWQAEQQEDVDDPAHGNL